jgi:hydroxymethylpyrimidine pyrophosphatase-like HAD family hydrolase
MTRIEQGSNHQRREQAGIGIKLLVFEKQEGEGVIRILPFVASDIDGTANDESLAESFRINSIGPAKEALGVYERLGMPVWLITSRTIGEGELYQQKMNLHGGIIGEEGISIALPAGVDLSLAQNIPDTYLAKHGEKHILIQAPKDAMQIVSAAIRQAQSQSGTPLISSLVYEGEGFTQLDERKLTDLMTAAGHHSTEAAVASTIRFASAYVVLQDDKQKKAILDAIKDNSQLRMRDHGRIIELYASKHNKATALKLAGSHLQVFFPHAQVDRLFPIVFGNRQNDIAMMQYVGSEGIAVLVAGPEQGRYYLTAEELSSLPHTVIKTRGVAGEGLKEAVSLVFQKLHERFGFTFQD